MDELSDTTAPAACTSADMPQEKSPPSQPARQDGWTLRPSRQRWYAYLRFGLGLDLLFLAVYGGTNLLNSARESHFRLHFPWEADLPLIPELVYPYFSILLLFALPPFVLEVRALGALARHLAAATLVAGAMFLLLPTEPGFARLPAGTTDAGLFQLLYAVDYPHNLFPSLHVAYSVLTAGAIYPHCPAWFRAVLLGWIGLICVTVVLIHQHHIPDVLGGLLLAWGVRRAWTPAQS